MKNLKNLTNKVKNRVIVFFVKGHKFITQDEEEFFLGASNGSAIGTTLGDGTYINFSSVAKIIGIDEFYMEHPELRPQDSKMMDLFDRGNVEVRKFGKYSTKGLNLMREGLIGYIQKTPWNETGTRPAQKVLEKMDEQIECLDRNSNL